MTIARRTITAEMVTAGACMPWLVRGAAVSANRGINILDALAMAGAPEEVHQRIKAAIAAGSTSGLPEIAGSSTIVASFMDQLAETSIFARLLSENAAQKVPLRTRLIGWANDPTAGVVEEGRPIPVRGIDLTGQSIEPFKIAAMIVLSNELVRNISAAGPAFFIAKLREAVARAADVEMFARLTDSSTLQLTVGDEVYDADAANIGDAFKQMLDTVHLRAGSRPHWAMTPAAANYLQTLPGGEFSQDWRPLSGSMLDLPVTLTNGMEGRRIALIAGKAVAGEIESVRVDASESGAIQLADDPTNNPMDPTATNMVSLFQNNAIAMRVVMTLACEQIRDNPIAFLDIEEPSG